ncbi:MAG: hypothetical protein VYE68_12985 [Acidobacteriota bacterium]|nr:hypothetical protein [Acidobacteriota bacterium]
MTETSRGRAFTDALIRRSLAEQRATTDCPEPAILAAFYERALDQDETVHWTAHLADCQLCQSTLSAMVESEAAVGEPEPTDHKSRWRWSGWRAMAPIAAAAVVLLGIWVVDPMWVIDSKPTTTGSESPSATREQLEPRAPDAEVEARQTVSDTPELMVASAGTGESDRSAEASPPPRNTAPQRPSPPPAAPPGAAPAPASRDRVRPPVETLGTQNGARLSPPDWGPSHGATEGGTFVITSPDPSVRWRISNERTVQRSIDGGVSWDSPLDAGGLISAGVAPTPDVLWLVGEDGLVRRATDVVGWLPSTSPTDVGLSAIEAIDDVRATITTVDGRRFTTTDGGQRWIPDEND